MSKQDEAREAFNAARAALVNASEALELAAEAAYAAYKEAEREERTCKACKDAEFYPRTGLMQEYEEEVYKCSECGEVLSYDENFDPDTDFPNYCQKCGARVTGIGEPWNE